MLNRQFVILTVLRHKTERLSSEGVGRSGERKIDRNLCRHIGTGDSNSSMELAATLGTVITCTVVRYKHT